MSILGLNQESRPCWREATGELQEHPPNTKGQWRARQGHSAGERSEAFPLTTVGLRRAACPALRSPVLLEQKKGSNLGVQPPPPTKHRTQPLSPGSFWYSLAISGTKQEEPLRLLLFLKLKETGSYHSGEELFVQGHPAGDFGPSCGQLGHWGG